MVRNNNKLLPHILFISAVLILFSSCVSLKIKGKTPAQRAQSAAKLLIDGKTTDAYIKQYNKEMDKALEDIDNKLIKIETNPEAYEAVADSVQDWIDLYDEIYILENYYPQGLHGKKHSAFFVYIDYRPLKEKAAILACESQFNKAKDLLARSYSFSDKTLVLEHLQKAKSYSSHLNDEINPMGAQINYEEAQRLFTSVHSSDLKKSWLLFEAASQWNPDYNNSTAKALEAKKKAARAMAAEGDEEIKKQNYSAFRKAYSLFKESKTLGYAEAETGFKQAAKLLTVKLGIIYSGRESYYPNEQSVKSSLSQEAAKNSRGPMFLETDFIYMPSSSSVFEIFINTFSAVINAITSGSTGLSLQNYDLLAYPGENFNKVMEKIAKPVREVEIIEKYYCETRIKKPGQQDQVVIKEISGFEYKNPRPSEKNGEDEIILSYWAETGKIIKDIQVIEVWKDYSYELYDVRKNRRVYLGKLERSSDKTVYKFVKSSYTGSEAVRPKVLQMDDFYAAERFHEFGLKVNEVSNPYEIISTTSYTLNEAGKIICNEIGRLEYLP